MLYISRCSDKMRTKRIRWLRALGANFMYGKIRCLILLAFCKLYLARDDNNSLYLHMHTCCGHTLPLRMSFSPRAIHCLTPTSNFKPVTADNLWIFIPSLCFIQHIPLVATCWIIPSVLCCTFIISYIIFFSAATTPLSPQGSLKFNLSWTKNLQHEIIPLLY